MDQIFSFGLANSIYFAIINQFELQKRPIYLFGLVAKSIFGTNNRLPKKIKILFQQDGGTQY